MTRVSENSNTAALRYALNRTKEKMEELQLKGSTLKNITRPSDNPISNVEAMTITSTTSDNTQYLKNCDFAQMHLSVAEQSLDELTNLVTKAKEIAIAQSSDFFNPEVKKNISNEVQQLYNQALAIANKKVGLKHLFSGYDTLTVPFDSEGKYHGDKGHISLEISRDFYVPINLTGEEVFYNEEIPSEHHGPLEKFENFEKSPAHFNREPSSKSEVNGESGFTTRENIFTQIQALATALENNDSKMIQGLLEKYDHSINRLITLRTKIGSIENSIDSSRAVIEKENVDHAARKSSLLDSDVLELFSDINKQQSILKTTYQSSQGVMNQTLMDFLRR